MKKLPQRFLDDMKELLMDEYDDFIKSYDEPKTTGLRINTLKINKEELLNLNLYNLTPIPWADEGFYYDEEVDRIFKEIGYNKDTVVVNYEIGDKVKIIEGPFKMLAGKITELDIEAGKANVSIDLFGQETNVELALTDFTKE